MEMLKNIPPWIYAFIAISIIFDIVGRVRKKNAQREGDLAEDSSVEHYDNSYDYDDDDDAYEYSAHDSYTAQKPEEHRYIEQKSYNASSTDMFPRGDSLRKIQSNAMFRRAK